MNRTHDDAPILIRHDDLAAATADGLITPAQADALWNLWRDRAASRPEGPRFGFTNVLYYFGGMLAIGSMSLFMTLGWAALGASGLLVITLFNIAACLVGARWLETRRLPTPAGILATLAIVLTPLAAWCAQHLMGLWPDGSTLARFSDYHRFIDWRWLTLEATTLIAAVAMLARHRHPFMVMPVAVTLWYLSMDVVSGIVGVSHFDSNAWRLYRAFSLAFGLVMVLVAVWVDLRTRMRGSRRDFAFWLYLFGAVMAWAALSGSDSSSATGRAVYGAINVALVFFGAAIGRRVFTVLGGFGVAGYVGWLSYRLFGDSLLFPFALCLLGLAIVALGVWWQRHEASVQARLARWTPAFLRPLTARGWT